ncbi:MAG: protoporphyrinogen oxidase [Puniceicoccaceae bacterium]|nr:protoporphyrinogen oxidase [Puniceicoccaceae bacterium]RCL31522.1 MAG: protoporphyrinogen oxidase [Puniceicoccaceae bacterium]
MAKVAILGAGLRGLYVADRLEKLGHRCTVFEATNRIGGAIRSKRHPSGYLTEDGAHTFLVHSIKVQQYLDSFPDLMQRSLRPETGTEKRYIVHKGKLHLVEANPKFFLNTSLLSPLGKLRFLSDFFKGKQCLDPRISLYDLIKLHFGNECADRLLDPFIAGTYAGDPKKLSAQFTAPQLFKTSSTRGSLLKSTLREKGFKSHIISFVEGLNELPEAIAQRLEQAVLTNTKILSIKALKKGWQLNYQIADHPPEQHNFDCVCATLPAHAMMSLPLAPEVRDLLPNFADIEHPPVSVLSLGFHKNQFQRALSGFGYLIPSSEKESHLGVLFSSTLFKHRAPSDHCLITAFIGGSRNPELTQLDASQLIKRLLPRISSYCGINGVPAFSYLRTWKASIPQYHCDYHTVHQQIEDFEKSQSGFILAGNYRKGIALGNCFDDDFLKHPFFQSDANPTERATTD